MCLPWDSHETSEDEASRGWPLPHSSSGPWTDNDRWVLPLRPVGKPEVMGQILQDKGTPTPVGEVYPQGPLAQLAAHPGLQGLAGGSSSL